MPQKKIELEIHLDLQDLVEESKKNPSIESQELGLFYDYQGGEYDGGPFFDPFMEGLNDRDPFDSFF